MKPSRTKNPIPAVSTKALVNVYVSKSFLVCGEMTWLFSDHIASVR
jgi:hypothetical protein